MQPYQKATDEILRQGELPKKALKTAASTALAAGSTTLAGKALSLVNRYVPENIAIKGLNKLDPRFGNFITKAMAAGKSFDEVRDFISQKAGEGMQENQQTEPPKEDRNIIEQYSPELNQFMKEKIGAGEDPIKAAALALFQKGNNFESVIRKMEKDHKTNWSQLVQSIYGGQGAKMTPNQPQNPQQQQSNQQQGGPGQQALMDILNRINQRLGQ